MAIHRGFATRLVAAGLLLFCTAAAQPLIAQPFLVKNINQVAEQVDSTPLFLADLGDTVVFTANGPEHSGQLWASDGTTAGTTPIASDLTGFGFPRLRRLWQRGAAVFFTSLTEIAPERFRLHDLWVTDGTTAGTARLTYGVDVYEAIGELNDLGLVFFAAEDQELGKAYLVVTDGTPVGTHPLKELQPEPIGPGATAGGELFFFARGGGGTALWKTDGTAAGTVRVKAVNPWPPVGGSWVVPFGAGVLFIADDGVHGEELWVSDGTEAGTKMVQDLRPGSASTVFRSPIVPIGPFAFFVADDLGGTTGLWRTDGTVNGLVRLGTFAASPFRYENSPDFRAIEGTLVFAIDDRMHGIEPWLSDGTPAGTRLLRDICPGACSSGASRLQPTGLGIHFTADDGVHGEEPWISDLSTGGTRLFADLCPGSCAGLGGLGGDLSGLLILIGYGPAPEYSQQLWASDGTPGGTLQVSDFVPPAALSRGGFGGTAHGAVVFAAADGPHGLEPWRSDGTPGGTYLLRDIAVGGDGSSYPEQLTRVGDRVFLVADDGVHGDELWRTDGSEAGTALVADTDSGTGGPNRSFSSLTPAGDALYYLVYRYDLGTLQLWRSDGSALGTQQLLELDYGPTTTLAPIGEGALLFRSDALWFSDGSVAGTRKVRDIAVSNNHRDAGVFHGEVYFSASDGPDTDYELWKSDGTPEGTLLVKDIGADGQWGDPGDFVAFGSRLYFTAMNDVQRELWRTDGTAAGTEQVVDLADFQSADPYYLNVVGNRLLFFDTPFDNQPGLWATDGTGAGTVHLAGVAARRSDLEQSVAAAGPSALFFLVPVSSPGFPTNELWRSDGTPAGTASVQSLLPADTDVEGLWPAGDRVVLDVRSTDYTEHLWVTDGTPAGTRRIADFDQPLTFFGFAVPAVLGSLVLFRAAEPVAGVELWAAEVGADLPPPPPPPSLPPPAAPTGLEAIAVAPYAVHLTWTDASVDETSFVIERSSPFADFVAFAELPAGSESFDFPGLGAGVPYTFRVRALGAGGMSAPSNEASATPYATAIDTCSPTPEALCLLGGRFEIQAWWHDQHNDHRGRGTAVPFAGSKKTGFFWFFNPANVELGVKNLDGRSVNGFVWTFYGALSDVEYWVTVTDTEQGRNRTYHNPPGSICGIGDTASFPEPVPALRTGGEPGGLLWDRPARESSTKLQAWRPLLASPRVPARPTPAASACKVAASGWRWTGTISTTIVTGSARRFRRPISPATSGSSTRPTWSWWSRSSTTPPPAATSGCSTARCPTSSTPSGSPTR